MKKAPSARSRGLCATAGQGGREGKTAEGIQGKWKKGPVGTSDRADDARPPAKGGEEGKGGRRQGFKGKRKRGEKDPVKDQNAQNANLKKMDEKRPPRRRSR